jgi:hypothetical protein
MGHTVEVRVRPNVVEVRYRDRVVQTMPRLATGFKVDTAEDIDV